MRCSRIENECEGDGVHPAKRLKDRHRTPQAVREMIVVSIFSGRPPAQSLRIVAMVANVKTIPRPLSEGTTEDDFPI
jgi:hypothetical protein